jgi:hypothetical protein
MIGVKGIMLWPFIVVRDKKDLILVNHERIHYYQANELWVIKFYWLYFKWYFKNRKIFKGYEKIKHYWSYRNIPFEAEAFTNQSNLEYLKTRKRFAYRLFLKH